MEITTKVKQNIIHLYHRNDNELRNTSVVNKMHFFALFMKLNLLTNMHALVCTHTPLNTIQILYIPNSYPLCMDYNPVSISFSLSLKT